MLLYSTIASQRSNFLDSMSITTCCRIPHGIAKKQFIGFEEFGVHDVETKHIEFEILDAYHQLTKGGL